MSEGFLHRWSRLKREAALTEAEAQDAASPAPEAAPAPADGLTGTDLEPRDGSMVSEPLDPVCLPRLEDLGADSDYKPFLSEHVPDELRRLALRKAWASDPAIAGFRGFAEYDWDCNAPGFGQLLACDDVERLARAVLGDGTSEPAQPEPSVAREEAVAPDEAATHDGALPGEPATDLPGPAEAGDAPVPVAAFESQAAAAAAAPVGEASPELSPAERAALAPRGA